MSEDHTDFATSAAHSLPLISPKITEGELISHQSPVLT